MRFVGFLLSLFVLPGAAFAQAASYSLSGPACTTGRLTSSLGAVPLVAIKAPRIGTTFEVETESSANYPWGNRRRVVLLTGFSNTSAGGAPLPFDLGSLALGAPICGLLSTSAEISIAVPMQLSYLTPSRIAIPIPNQTSLIGLRFYQQAASRETSSFGPPFFSLALSRLGTGVIGL